MRFPAPTRIASFFSKLISSCVIVAFSVSGGRLGAGIPPEVVGRAQPIALQFYRINPTRVVWQSGSGVEHPESLLAPKSNQVTRPDPILPCTLTVSAEGAGGILLDFGTELNGNIEIATVLPPGNPSYQPKVRVRFGESASEAMSDLGDRQSSNDYAIRDEVLTLPWTGTKIVGPTGFRFVRIDAVDSQQPVPLRHVRAILTVQDAPQIGSFRCSDEQLNQIWQAGAYTVRLNMQDYVWDGIKRDRLVWTGDLHPELAVILAVFGANASVPRSLDLIRDVTPPAKWMHGISSYSLWWVLMQEQWWRQVGDRGYLEAQKPYLQALLTRLAELVDQNGIEHLDGMRYLDWPTWENKPGIAAGLQALLAMALEDGSRLLTELGDNDGARLCTEAALRAQRNPADANHSKAAAALQVLAGMRDPKTGAEFLSKNGPTGMSPFYGFYVLQALGKAGATDTALGFIRTYWGAMLDRGATTFWEDFDLSWLENSGRIDELRPAGKKDLHGDFGIYGSAGFRKSLCHGWSAGPTAFLSEHVLGIRPLKPGCTEILVAPHLGNLAWAEGSYPTPHGPIKVRHERQPDGSIRSIIDAPPGVKITRGKPPSL